jgi:amino acid transporter
MVAGWDNLLPGWFSRLHRRYKTPINSILFVGIVTLLFAIVSQLGVGAQEAFQLIDNAAGIFYGIAYLALFAIPICGLRALPVRAPLWLRIAATIGFLVTLLYIVLTIVPIVHVEGRAADLRKSSSPHWARTCSAPSSSSPPAAGKRLLRPDFNAGPRPQSSAFRPRSSDILILPSSFLLPCRVIPPHPVLIQVMLSAASGAVCFAVGRSRQFIMRKLK